MKKRVVWTAVLVVSLLICGTALGVSRPPQTAGEVPVPSHTVPVISNVQISGNSITMDIVGPITEGDARIELTTSTMSTETRYISFTRVGDTLVGEVTGLPADTTGWEMLSFDLYLEPATPGTGISISYSYDGDGKLEGYGIQDLDTNARYSFCGDGLLESYSVSGLSAVYASDGSLDFYKVTLPNGEQRYNGQHQLEYEEYWDADTGTLTAMHYQNGVLVARTLDQGDISHTYDGQGRLRRTVDYSVSGIITENRYDVNGNLHSYSIISIGSKREQFDAAGNLVSRDTSDGDVQTYEEFENGQQVYKRVYVELPDGQEYYDIYQNGVYTERIIIKDDEDYHYDAEGNYTGKTVYDNNNGYKRYNADGALIEYMEYSDQQGGVMLTYNSKKDLLSVEYIVPYIGETYRYDAKAKVWYLNGVRYDGPAPIDISKLKLAKEIVWYPSNTVCSFGPQFRDIDPDLTKLWYMFTPIDLSKDGTQTFELIGGNVYVLGHVYVTVNGDSVTVTYKTVKGKYGHIYMKSEYLNFFKDLASVTTVVPEEIGEGFKFGEPISIEKDLGGDTNVLMFIRNVATFRNYVDDNTLLRRYYKNYPSRAKLREAMLAMMD